MTTLTVAFAMAWAFITMYIGWISVHQRVLAQRVRDLEEFQMRPQRTKNASTHSKAA